MKEVRYIILALQMGLAWIFAFIKAHVSSLSSRFLYLMIDVIKNWEC